MKFKITHSTDNEDEYNEISLIINSWHCLGCDAKLTSYERHNTEVCAKCDGE